MVFNAPFYNISAISWRSVFIGGGNRRKPLTNYVTLLYWVDLAMNHEISQNLIKYNGIMIYIFVGNITVVKEVIIMYR